jgi:fructuronate reductase
VSFKAPFSRERLKKSWVHIGNGHFFRAHQIYFNDLAILKNGQGIACSAINLRSKDIVDLLGKQNNMFTIATEKSKKTMGSLVESLHLATDLDQCRQKLISSQTTLISLTITEKGYRAGEPAMNLLLEICEARMRSHGSGLCFLSCDNLQKNGQVLKRILLSQAKPEVAKWLQDKCFFPSSMVDRIVPHFTIAELQEKQKDWGFFDPCAIFTEEFCQWIIEDNCGPFKPPWQGSGVEFVTDVTAYEKIKLQVLNASHSWLAYRGLLKNYIYVSDCMNDLELQSELTKMIQTEIAPQLSFPANFDFAEYINKMLTRFRNPSIQHRLSQIALDGVAKIPQRWSPSFSSETPLLLKGLVAWFRYHEKSDSAKTHGDFETTIKDLKLLPERLRDDDKVMQILRKELQSI